MKRWPTVLAVLVLGAVIGAGGLIASTFVNTYTSTESFCTSCHSMTELGTDPHYLQSPHRLNAEGVRANCADCHIPATNWFVETYTHVSAGIRDAIAEYTTNISDPSVWAARAPGLADSVREELRRENGVTCRKCHDPVAIHPTSEAGRAAHALLAQGRVTCIDCHFNLVHAPVPPSASFLRGSGLGRGNP
jgi:cytochrome c-type protein NapC